MISIHGLIRGIDPEHGCDADTGGQTKYVLELARALSSHEAVERVDLVTRCIDEGLDAYILKEELWVYLDAFIDELNAWLHRQPRLPDVIHSHYADAGYVGVKLANFTGLPLNQEQERCAKTGPRLVFPKSFTKTHAIFTA